MFFIKNNQSEIYQGSKNGAPGSEDKPGFSGLDSPPFRQAS
jgi:hypothetical protein